VNYGFVDCRWSLDDPGFGRRSYLAGHIPGAAFVDLERDLAGPAGPGGRHPLPDADTFAAAMRRVGISAETFVVAYGPGGAERLWWLLRHFGHDACAVVDLAAWRGPLAAGEEDPVPGTFEAHARTGDTIERDELAASLGELALVDARLPARWRGEPNPIDRIPGRIPGAVNVPWSDPEATLPDGEPVVYCGSGITACVVLHRLHLAGREGRLYPGSWSEWEQFDLPRASG